MLDHTIGKEISRISKIAERAGIDASELTGIFSTNAAEKIPAMKRFDEVAEKIIKESTIENLNLQGGRQQAYYLPSANKADEGIIVLKYDGKKNTMMAAGRDYYDRLFGIKNL